MSKTIRTTALLLLALMVIAGCRMYEHARRAAVHAIVNRSVAALQPLTQSTYRPAPLHESITVTAKAPDPDPDPDPEPVVKPVPVARSLRSIGNAPGVQTLTCSLPVRVEIIRVRDLRRALEDARAELALSRVCIELERRRIVIEVPSI